MLSVLAWWLIVTLMGFTALPIGVRLFNRLPGRGYALSKAFGLLLVSYLFWISGSFKLLGNSWGGIVVAWAAVGVVSGALYFRSETTRSALSELFSRRRGYILAAEGIFLVTLVGWAIFRSYDPDLIGTEKPMEFAFLNAILRSPSFPPHDPWMSGYAISYYYFGYVMMAMITKLSSTVPAVAFNLGNALLFALTLTGSFGVVYELISWRAEAKSEGRTIGFSLLGPLFVGIVGNLEGLLESLHAKGLGSAQFWNWIRINGLASAPVTGTFLPTDNWWWWRASRVVYDVNALGEHSEVIDEFPYFSFILSDMHPHVLALPFVMLAIALAIQVIRWAADQMPLSLPSRDTVASWFRQWLTRNWQRNLFIALILGALGFLNTWDFPIYWGLVTLCYAAGRYLASRKFDGALVLDVVLWAGRILLAGVVLFLPFYLGFTSQAGGILPEVLNATPIQQYFVMFGLLLVISLAFAVRTTANWLRTQKFAFSADVKVIAVVAAFLVLLAVVFGKWTALAVTLLAAVLAVAATRRLASIVRAKRDDEDPALNDVIVAIMMVVAFLLTIAVEFVFLKDYFGTRMNTVFKFYYQAWVLLALGGAYTLWVLFGREQRAVNKAIGVAKGAFGVVFVALLSASLVYTFTAGYSKANGFTGQTTLNCLAFSEKYEPAEYNAIAWLNANVQGTPVILEATGGSYTEYARVSARTGLPTLLGWDFHELQWRGNQNPAGSRAQDVETIYRMPDGPESLTLLNQYGIRYIYVGNLERTKYGLNDAIVNRWDNIAERVYDRDGVRIYAYSPN